MQLKLLISLSVLTTLLVSRCVFSTPQLIVWGTHSSSWLNCFSIMFSDKILTINDLWARLYVKYSEKFKYFCDYTLWNTILVLGWGLVFWDIRVFVCGPSWPGFHSSLLPESRESWDYRYVSPHLVSIRFKAPIEMTRWSSTRRLKKVESLCVHAQASLGLAQMEKSRGKHISTE